jgi:hypothetical protein
VTFVPRVLATILFLALAAPVMAAGAQSTDSARIVVSPTRALTPDSVVDPNAADTPNDFMDLERDLTLCISSNPLPGCGREPTGPGDRGGWQQFLLFGIMMTGIGLIFWRVGRSIRARDRLIARDANPLEDVSP